MSEKDSLNKAEPVVPLFKTVARIPVDVTTS
jgi:hypothetical protein